MKLHVSIYSPALIFARGRPVCQLPIKIAYRFSIWAREAEVGSRALGVALIMVPETLVLFDRCMV
jgi:hypothetical protein